MKSPYDLPDYFALIRGIREIDRAGRDSTLARLVCADWLQDHGEESRATYIRWRCDDPTPFEHAPGDGTGSIVLLDPEAEPVEVELAPRHAGVQFSSAGGWVVGVRCPLAWWLTRGPDLCRRHPVREVVITDASVQTYQQSARVNATVAGDMIRDGEAVTTPADRYYLLLYKQLRDAIARPTEWLRNTTGHIALLWAEHEADTTSEG